MYAFFIAIITLLSWSQQVGANETLAKKELHVYTYDSFMSEWGPGPKLEAEFEAYCHCDVKFSTASDGVSLLNRLRMEAGSTQADVILGLDQWLMQAALATGLIREHQLELKNQLKLTLQWQNTYFLPYDYGYFAFIYDENNPKVTQVPHSLKALLESDSKIIYQDPRTSTPGQGLLIWMNQVFHQNVSTAWKKLAQRTVTVTPGWWEAYSMFLKGEADYVLSYTSSPLYHILQEKKSNYKAAIFDEGHPMQIEVAAITNKSQNFTLAQMFLKFLLRPQIQVHLATSNWMFPVIADTIDLPEPFYQLVMPKALLPELNTVENNKRQWIRQWRSMTSE
ncbi:thiamine transport system substrate-binding protein [Allopseudospirillum japonicum]|uniref:Thiamine-binding periplasmic protein n=1 Tax=Allopseudospirillum japonicum TaxID=64971 RepID=A0A1H6QB56_9GAMM|nr:thiamine ABC transporter substrate binding subunit [Allopseudospirillum japonicum]SEI37397.1 thiamine transport system substrate-binding protein [Allopseudospirillum japonicum]